MCVCDGVCAFFPLDDAFLVLSTHLPCTAWWFVCCVVVRYPQMGDAQASCDEAMQNYDMMSFYTEFLNKIRDDQLRFDGNHPNDTGALADVVPFDGIGGNPGCPVWQVAYIVIPHTMVRRNWTCFFCVCVVQLMCQVQCCMRGNVVHTRLSLVH